MKKPTWICDACGQEIEDAEHGWVEWLTEPGGGDRQSHGLRLVHQERFSPRRPDSLCYYNEKKNPHSGAGDLPLTSFLGPDGLMLLLSFLHDKEFREDEEVLEMIKRLHVPSYEHAFRHIEDAVAEGVFEPNTAPLYCHQDDIKAVLEWAKNRDA